MDGDYKIDDELSLFTVSKTNKFYSPANKSLYDEKGKDTFRHEQNLIISEKQAVLIMGCGHAGVVNINAKAEKYRPCFLYRWFSFVQSVYKEISIKGTVR